MSNITVTDLEKKLLGAYQISDYGEAPDHCTWVFAVIDDSGIPAKQARGVLTSLVKKGLIYVLNNGMWDKEACTGLTVEGQKLSAELGLVSEHNLQYQPAV